MCKWKRNIFAMLLILLIPIDSFASAKNTIDDLRVLMGMQRLSEHGYKTEIKRLLSTCYKQKEWNELVAALGEVEDAEWKDFIEKEDAWYQAKDILEANFISNKPIETILNDYTKYQTAASLRMEYTKTNAIELSFIDTNDIESNIAYANSLLESTTDATNIGVIGHNMKTFTQSNLLITVPFGRTISNVSGKELLSDGLTISIQQEHAICSQFHGMVTAVTEDSVTVKTGKSIEVEYLGIKPAVVKQQKVKQYDIIGTTKTNSMSIKFKMNTVYVDPLLLYGSRSTSWYEQWEKANPGCLIEEKDYSSLLDKLPEKMDEITSEAYNPGRIVSEEGNSAPIIMDGENNYKDTPDDVTIDKKDLDIIINEDNNTDGR